MCMLKDNERKGNAKRLNNPTLSYNTPYAIHPSRVSCMDFSSCFLQEKEREWRATAQRKAKPKHFGQPSINATARQARARTFLFDL